MREETKSILKALGWMYLALLVWVVTVLTSSVLSAMHDPWAIPNFLCGFLLSASFLFRGGKLLRRTLEKK